MKLERSKLERSKLKRSKLKSPGRQLESTNEVGKFEMKLEKSIDMIMII